MSTHTTPDRIEHYPDVRYPEPGPEPVKVAVEDRQLLQALRALQKAEDVLRALSALRGTYELLGMAAEPALREVQIALGSRWPVSTP